MTSGPVDVEIYKRPAELLQQLIRFDTTNPPGNERVPVEAPESGAEALFRLLQRLEPWSERR